MIQPISVVIVTKNEEKIIERCLKSVQWANEIVVLIDNRMIDTTPDICRKYNCVVIFSDWLGLGLMKKLAVDSATNDWIFSIDSDEEVSDDLKNEILAIIQSPQYNGYRIKRIDYYLNKQIQHCGWDRDFPLRLFNRKHGNFNDKIVHEAVQIKGKIGRIVAPLYHYTYPTIHSHIEKMNHYTDLSTKHLIETGKSSLIISAIVRGLIKFIKMYFLRLGFLDGKIGFVLCYNSAFGVYLKYIKLWEKSR